MENAVRYSLGKIISRVEFQGEGLFIRFADGTGLELEDNGKQCCNARYMHTDDDLDEVVGGTLYGIEIRDVPPDGWQDPGVDEDGKNDVHEIQFLVLKTSKGEIVVSTHNEHNGNYSGFHLEAKVHLALAVDRKMN